MNVEKNEIVSVLNIPGFFFPQSSLETFGPNSNPLKSVAISVISMETGTGFHTVNKDEV